MQIRRRLGFGVESLENRCLLAALLGPSGHSVDGGDSFGELSEYQTTGSISLASEDFELAPSANLFPTAVRIVDGSNNEIVPIAGERFWVRVEFTYDNPTSDSYRIGRTVNANPQHLSPEINWGSGFTGRTTWSQYWGAWVLHESGTYEVTVTLDTGNSVEEVNELDNSMTIEFNVSGTVTPEWVLVGADQGRTLFGDGTDVIVGTMDDAFDYNHPWFSGSDSLGRPRLIAELQNNLGTDGGPINANHATPVMGIVLANGPNKGDIIGLAPDARYVTAEFIDRAQLGHGVVDVFDAAGFLVEHGVEVINMSWSWWAGTASDSYAGETSKTNLMVDYLAYGRNIVAIPAVNQLGNHAYPTAPGSSRNVITVGGLNAKMDRAWSEQDHGPTTDGRSKPELLGNAAVDSVSTSANWRNGFLAGSGYNGTSFAAPFVTGAVAQMLDYGKRVGENTDHRVIKAIVTNSGVKSFDANGDPWSNEETRPLDDQQGAGILNIPRMHAMYSAGEQETGGVAVPGYDFANIQSTDTAGAGRVVYSLGSPTPGSDLDVTLVWDRHTFWDDANGNDRIDVGDSFYVNSNDVQDNLDLVLYRDGIQIDSSVSTVDTVEHLHLTNLVAGDYELHVVRRDVANSGSDEDFALAWHSNGVWNATRDYGDAPAPYPTAMENAASHLAVGPQLGSARDAELDGFPTVDALGDDSVGVADEDGVMFGNLIVSHTMAGVNIHLENSTKAYVDAWLDFNRDGDWDDNDEQILASAEVTEAMQTLNFALPAGLTEGNTFARVRLSSTGGLSPTGFALDGEVEDYQIPILAPAEVETVTINQGDTQRSSIDSLQLTFNRTVDISTTSGDPFVFVNQVTGETVTDTFTYTESQGKSIVDFRFLAGASVTSFGSLMDGNYKLTIDANLVTHGGLPFDGDKDGAAGGDFLFGQNAVDTFFRNYGDYNGNRTVDLLDFAEFRRTFGSAEGDVQYRDPLDADGDNSITLLDFAAFRRNFGT